VGVSENRDLLFSGQADPSYSRPPNRVTLRTRPMGKTRFQSLLVLLAIAAAPAAWSQDEATEPVNSVTTSADGATVTYHASFFERYDPISALDMLRWIPGTSDLIPAPGIGSGDNGGQERGFGSGGDQVLINGKRLSGKSNDIASAVQRIQARAVVRIEVIRGTVSGLDVRTEGILVNIVLAEDIGDGAGSWQVHASNYEYTGVNWDGLLSYGSRVGQLKYLLSLEVGPHDSGTSVYAIERYFAPDGSQTERREIIRPRNQGTTTFAGGATWTFRNEDLANFNVQVEDGEQDNRRTLTSTLTGSKETETAVEREQVDQFEWELGADMENRVGSGSLETRLILTDSERDSAETVSQISNVNNLPDEALITIDEEDSESIIRSSYTWDVRDAHTLELGAEGARNTLDQLTRLFERLPDDSLVEVDVFNADTEVVEDRYEAFGTHYWSMAPDKVLETGLNYEYSKIDQSGPDVNNTRSFTYLKPRLDYRWDRTERDQLRATLERTVSQLDFADFVATYDSRDDQITGGNPDLEPERAWEWQLTYEHRLADDGGVVSARLFFNDIEDHIARVEVEEGVAGPGNIGDAEHWGVEFKGSFRLDGIGLDGAVVDAVYKLQDSETTDAFTGERREIENKPRQDIELTYRHDIPALRLNYTVEVQWQDDEKSWDLSRIERDTELKPRHYVTVQYRAFEQTTVYFQARQPFEYRRRRHRDRYDGSIADGELLRSEISRRTVDPEYALGLRGQF
jgi:outer membrane receptor protein involved in Fe transport